MARCEATEEGFFYGALKIAVGVFVGGLAAMFAYEYILGLRMEGRLKTVFDKPPAVMRPYRVEVEVPRPTVGEIEWSNDPSTKQVIKR